MERTGAVEGFAIETVEGFIFTVKGLVHPPDATIAYLRYLPSPGGDRVRGGVPYRRVYRLDEQREVLHGRFPAYIGHDPVFGFEVQRVPNQCVRKVYDPCSRLAEMSGKGARDPLEEKVLAFADLLKEASGVPTGSLGISGSVLVGLHRPASDIDLTVYGDAEARAVNGTLRRLLDGGRGAVRRLDRTELAALHAAHQPDTPLPFPDFARLQSRKVNEGFFGEIPYFIRFIKCRRECGEQYGDASFEQLGKVAIRFRVADDRDAVFTPCRYAVEDARFLDRAEEIDLREVISFRGRFSDQVRAGEPAAARGTLERVVPRNGGTYHRLSVGGDPGDYLVSRGVPVQ